MGGGPAWVQEQSFCAHSQNSATNPMEASVPRGWSTDELRNGCRPQWQSCIGIKGWLSSVDQSIVSGPWVLSTVARYLQFWRRLFPRSDLSRTQTLSPLCFPGPGFPVSGFAIQPVTGTKDLGCLSPPSVIGSQILPYMDDDG